MMRENTQTKQTFKARVRSSGKRKTIYLLFTLVLIITGMLYLDSCKKEDPPVETDPVELDDFIMQLPELEQVAESSEIISEDTIDLESDADDYVCETTTYSDNQGFSTMLFKDNVSQNMYPGALLNGASIIEGSYTPCNLTRKPVTLTVKLPSLVGDISRTVESPSLSTIETAIHELLSQELDGDQGAEMSWTYKEIHSESQLKAFLNAGFKVGEAFEGGLDMKFGYETKRKLVVAKFKQKYYDIVIDSPVNPCDFIDLTGMSEEEVKKRLGTTSPVYISKVSYGRYLVYTFETKDMGLDFELKMNGKAPIDESGQITASAKGGFSALLKDSSITSNAYILGGSSIGAAAMATDPAQFQNFIEDGAVYSRENPGRPISFALNYLCNNKPVKIVMATEYTETECHKVSNKFRIKLEKIEMSKDGGWLSDVARIFGNITINLGGAGEPSILAPGDSILFEYDNMQIRQGTALEDHSPIDVKFIKLGENDNQSAYIEIATTFLEDSYIMGMGTARHFSDSNVTRKYLNEIIPGEEFSIETNGKWNIGLFDQHLTITTTFSIDKLD